MKRVIANTSEFNNLRDEVEKIVKDKIESSLDNIAHVVASKLPEYNADWCAEATSNSIETAINELTSYVAYELLYDHPDRSSIGY